MMSVSFANDVKRFFLLADSSARLCSRVTDECNREAELVKKKPRRQNLHYCPRDHLGNLGIHRSQSDFKIKRYERRQDGKSPPTKLRFAFSGTHLLLDCTSSSSSSSPSSRTAYIVYHRCSWLSVRTTADAGDQEGAKKYNRD